MREIYISEKKKKEIVMEAISKLVEELDACDETLNETNITLKTSLSSVAKDKITIIYTPKAYLRMMSLVQFYTTEVGWYGLVEKVNELTYKVYDIKICKQYVNGGKVDTEDEDTVEFFESLTDEEAEAMHFQAHSHVNMSTEASGTDLQNQADVVHNIGKTGFYIFQIWNKNLDINTYLYDLDNNIFYDRKDIVLHIEDDEHGVMDEYLKSTKELVKQKTVYPYMYGKQVSITKPGTKKKEYERYPTYEGWDW